MPATLLGPGDPPPYETLNEGSTSRVLLVCDHASCRVPAALGDLGLSETERTEHIGWDIGAGAVARRLSALLDAPAILAGYSRLVIDCNRPLGAPDRIPPVSDTVPVPGNMDLDQAAVDARIAEIFEPYHDAIAAALDRMSAGGRVPFLVAVHSFTPQLAGGDPRPWEIGICWDKDQRMSIPLIERLRAEGLIVGANEPYDFGVLTDHTPARSRRDAGGALAAHRDPQQRNPNAGGGRGLGGAPRRPHPRAAHATGVAASGVRPGLIPCGLPITRRSGGRGRPRARRD